MKKALVFLIALALLLPVQNAYGEVKEDMREFYNPRHYDVLLITDIFLNWDAEPDENGGFPDADMSARTPTVQGKFGTFLALEGAVPQTEGFEGDIFSISTAKDCIFLMPVDPVNPVENAPCENIAEWFIAQSQAANPYHRIDVGPYSFYAHFEMNENGELTQIEYLYLP